MEPSAGCDRTVLALICEAFDEETLTDEKGKDDMPHRAALRAAHGPDQGRAFSRC